MSYATDPRDYAMQLVEDERITAHLLAVACLKFLSHDQVREMLDDNELSPRFIDAVEA